MLGGHIERALYEVFRYRRDHAYNVLARFSGFELLTLVLNQSQLSVVKVPLLLDRLNIVQKKLVILQLLS